MTAASASETSVPFYHTTQRYIPYDRYVDVHRYETLKCHMPHLKFMDILVHPFKHLLLLVVYPFLQIHVFSLTSS